MRIAIAESIRAAAERIFELSQDYSKRLAWDPFLRRAILLDGAASAGVGVRSWCVAWFGIGMETEYVSYRPHRVAAVKMTKGPWILRQFAASWNYRVIDAEETEVRFVYSFRLRPLMRLLTPLIAALFRFEMKRRLAALKKACELAL